MLMATLDFDSHVDKFLVFAEQFPISLHRLRLVRHDTDDRGESSRADLPDVKVGYE